MARNFTKLSTLFALALGASTAYAGDVLFSVPEFRVNNVQAHDTILAEERAALDLEREVADYRLMEIADARRDLRQARRDRREAVRDRADAERAMNKALRKNIGVLAATAELLEQDRRVKEAHDEVFLHKERIDAKKERMDLAQQAVGVAKARLELAESRMLQKHDANGAFWHQPGRYEAQLDRELMRQSRDLASYRQSLVDVREARQDHYDPDFVVHTVTSIRPVEWMTDDAVSMDDTATQNAVENDLRRVHFDLGSDKLDTEALNDLAWNASVLRDHRNVSVEVEGHTDATGPMAFNRELAWDRAQSVEDFLLSQGVWDEQIETIGFGSALPLVPTSDATEANRRAEFRVLEDPDGMVDGTLDNDSGWSDFDEVR